MLASSVKKPFVEPSNSLKMLQTLHEELLKLLLMLNKNEYYEKNIPREKKIFFLKANGWSLIYSIRFFWLPIADCAFTLSSI